LISGANIRKLPRFSIKNYQDFQSTIVFTPLLPENSAFLGKGRKMAGFAARHLSD